jgi:hypothetical protein
MLPGDGSEHLGEAMEGVTGGRQRFGQRAEDHARATVIMVCPRRAEFTVNFRQSPIALIGESLRFGEGRGSALPVGYGQNLNAAPAQVAS